MTPKIRQCKPCGHKNRPYEVTHCAKCGERFLWRRTFGRKGYSLVTVYERAFNGPVQVMWWDRDGQHRETMTNLDGVPVYDQERAAEAAQKLSEGIGRKREKKQRTLRELAGVPERHTVGGLFATYHNDREGEWRKTTLRGNRRYRRFWETALGKQTDIREVHPATIRRIIAREAETRGWSLKTQNHYRDHVVEAWEYAKVFLKWITASDDLKAVRRHQIYVDNEDIAYEPAESQAISSVSEDVDLRCAVMVDMSLIGSRRINSIRNLRLDCHRTETRIVVLPGGTSTAEEFGVITFPAATEKAKQKGASYFHGRAKQRIERLVAKPAVQASGVLFPKGDLESRTPPKGLLGEDQLRDMLREVEKLAGVGYVKGRSYHGFNRAFGTMQDDVVAASAQSGKRKETIENIYAGARPELKAGLAMRLDIKLMGA